MTYYFVTIGLAKRDAQSGEWNFVDTVLKDKHPFQRLQELNKDRPTCYHRIMFFKEITEEEYDLFLGTTNESSSSSD